jgi:hypothetical protein
LTPLSGPVAFEAQEGFHQFMMQGIKQGKQKGTNQHDPGPRSFRRASNDHKRGHSRASSHVAYRKLRSICHRLREEKNTSHACLSVFTGSVVMRSITPFFPPALTRYSGSAELG